MGHFLDIAFIILSEKGEPLSSKDIVDLAIVKKLLKTKGKTPAQSMKARLSTDILKKNEYSIFVRTEAGKFGLRSWNNLIQYKAPRFKKSLLDEDVVVFPMSSLEKYIQGTGLYTTPLKNRKELLSELSPMRRRVAEQDFNVIQLVSAFIVSYQGKYLTYKRTKRLPEGRLHGLYSIPFGGHLNPEDILPLFDIFDPEIANVVLTRELREEIILPKSKMPEIVYKGLLYDDRREISRQHLGVVYDVHFNSPEFIIGERGFLIDAKFESLEEIEGRRADFENWSWIILDFERNVRIKSQRRTRNE